ncbi:HET-domain-containing protein [Ganoderma leucocontextum]|nr:HET-domain-containing protein [Ganoderma leucocontextum]
MRLLDVVTGEFVEFTDSARTPPYAILSHRWDLIEQIYRTVVEIQKSYTVVSTENLSSTAPPSIWDCDSPLSEKIKKACEAARTDGYRYIWIDSCCIDKTSSSELSESINYMVVFLSQTWEVLGTKSDLALLVEVTGIPKGVLTGEQSLYKCSVAQRMSWAAKRETTKVEDEAYALLGIFDINMPPLYGEGKRVFRRLQEEILTGDPFLADSPSKFIGAGKIVPIPPETFAERLPCKVPFNEYALTPYGIRTKLQVIPIESLIHPLQMVRNYPGTSGLYLAVLACAHSDDGPKYTKLLTRVCCDPLRSWREAGAEVEVCSGLARLWGTNNDEEVPSLISVDYREFNRCESALFTWTAYLTCPLRPTRSSDQEHFDEERDAVHITLPPWCNHALRMRGYSASFEDRSQTGDGTHRLTLEQRSVSDPTPAPIVITFTCVPESPDTWFIYVVAYTHVLGEKGEYFPDRQWQVEKRRVDGQNRPILGWRKRLPSVCLTVNANGGEVTFVLSLDLATASCYCLGVEVVKDTSLPTLPAPWDAV